MPQPFPSTALLQIPASPAPPISGFAKISSPGSTFKQPAWAEAAAWRHHLGTPASGTGHPTVTGPGPVQQAGQESQGSMAGSTRMPQPGCGQASPRPSPFPSKWCWGRPWQPEATVMGAMAGVPGASCLGSFSHRPPWWGSLPLPSWAGGCISPASWVSASLLPPTLAIPGAAAEGGDSALLWGPPQPDSVPSCCPGPEGEPCASPPPWERD